MYDSETTGEIETATPVGIRDLLSEPTDDYAVCKHTLYIGNITR